MKEVIEPKGDLSKNSAHFYFSVVKYVIELMR
jgi:hypothetical protein